MKITLLTLMTIWGTFAYAQTKSTPVWVDSRLFHPTQIGAGYEEIAIRRQKVLELSPAQYAQYLKKKVTKVILGPERSLWIVDGHHLAVIVISLKRYFVWAEIIQDWSALTWADFFKAMIEHHALWLFDETGRPSTIQDIPSRIEGLRDDPFRSLAWRVQNSGGYQSTDVFFADFMWANYFRQWISFEELRERPQVALKKALLLSQDPMARGLPGAIGLIKTPYQQNQIRSQDVYRSPLWKADNQPFLF